MLGGEGASQDDGVKKRGVFINHGKLDDDYPTIYRVLTIPGGAGFRPSTVNRLQLVQVGDVQRDVFWDPGSKIPVSARQSLCVGKRHTNC